MQNAVKWYYNARYKFEFSNEEGLRFAAVLPNNFAVAPLHLEGGEAVTATSVSSCRLESCLEGAEANLCLPWFVGHSIILTTSYNEHRAFSRTRRGRWQRRRY